MPQNLSGTQLNNTMTVYLTRGYGKTWTRDRIIEEELQKGTNIQFVIMNKDKIKIISKDGIVEEPLNEDRKLGNRWIRSGLPWHA